MATTLIFTTLLLFLPTLSFPFLDGWDDNLYVTDVRNSLSISFENIMLWCTCYVVGNYHPLTMFSLMFDNTVWGTNPLGFHIQNLFWHCVAVLGFYRCLSCLNFTGLLRFFTALVFAIHPQRVESVVWIAERKDVLCAALYIWSLERFLNSRRDTVGRFPVAAFVLFLGALLSKPMAISLPFILALYEIHRRRAYNFSALKGLWPFFIVSAVFIPVVLHSQQGAIEAYVDPLRQSAVVFHNVIFYILKLFYPVNLNPIYPRVAFTSMTALVLLLTYSLLLIALTQSYRANADKLRYDIVPLCLGYLVSLAPVSGLIPIGAIDYADRYSYLPSLFLLVLGAACARRFAEAQRLEPLSSSNTALLKWFRKLRTVLIQKSAIIKIVTIGYLVVISSNTIIYAQAWRSTYHLLSWANHTDTVNPVAIGMLAELEIEQGNFLRVFELADKLANAEKRGLQAHHIKALAIKADYLRGVAAYKLNNTRQALGYLSNIEPHLNVESLREVLNYKTYYSVMGDCYRSIGEYQKSTGYYNQVLETNPNDFGALLNRGASYFETKNYLRAVHDFERALELKPHDRRAAHNLVQAQNEVNAGPEAK